MISANIYQPIGAWLAPMGLHASFSYRRKIMYLGIVKDAMAGVKRMNPEIDLDKCSVISCENKTTLTLDFIEADLPPFEGEVAFIDSNCIVVKESSDNNLFVLVARHLATMVPEVGNKVRVKPYFRRNFDGSRVDGCLLNDGINSDYDCPYTFGESSKLPFNRPESHYLGFLYDQINNLKAPDSVRNIPQLLVDANARDFVVFDHEDELELPPHFEFFVSTGKFAGKVTILYESVLDLYLIFLWDDDEVIESKPFTNETIADLIDDGSWNKIQIDIVS
jgi:hypothetical protein